MNDLQDRAALVREGELIWGAVRQAVGFAHYVHAGWQRTAGLIIAVGRREAVRSVSVRARSRNPTARAGVNGVAVEAVRQHPNGHATSRERRPRGADEIASSGKVALRGHGGPRARHRGARGVQTDDRRKVGNLIDWQPATDVIRIYAAVAQPKLLQIRKQRLWVSRRDGIDRDFGRCKRRCEAKARG